MAPTAFQLIGTWLAALEGAGSEAFRRLTSGRTPGFRWRAGATSRQRHSIVMAGKMEVTRPARRMIERFAALVAPAIGNSVSAGALSGIVEIWAHEWHQVFRLPFARDQFLHRQTTWSEKHRRLMFERPLPRPRETPPLEELLVPEWIGVMVVDFGIRVAAAFEHAGGRELPAWLSEQRRTTFLRDLLPGVSARALAEIAGVSLSTAQRWFSGVRPSPSSLRRLYKLESETPARCPPGTVERIRTHFASVAALEILRARLPRSVVDDLCANVCVVARAVREVVAAEGRAVAILTSRAPVWSDRSVPGDDLLRRVAGGSAALPAATAASILEKPWRHPWRALAQFSTTSSSEHHPVKWPRLDPEELEMVLSAQKSVRELVELARTWRPNGA